MEQTHTAKVDKSLQHVLGFTMDVKAITLTGNYSTLGVTPDVYVLRIATSKLFFTFY